MLSSDGNIKTYVGGWQPCYDLYVVENSYNVMCEWFGRLIFVVT